LQYFISYSRKNQNFVFKLAHHLEEEGISLWLDQKDVPAGALWDDVTQNALRNANGLLAIISPDSINSQNVKDELAFAIDHKKLIVPIIYEHCQTPLRLNRLQHIDFTGNYDAAFQQLLIILKTKELQESEKPDVPVIKMAEVKNTVISDGYSKGVAESNAKSWLFVNGFRLIGTLFILLSAVFTLLQRCLSNAQYFTIYALIGVGIALVLVNSAEKSIVNAKIKNVGIYLSGGAALSFILFLTNPIGSFKADDCFKVNQLTSTTVYVHGKAGKQDMILRQQGYVIMDVHGERKKASINENGQTFFQNLKIGDSVRIEIDFSEPYKSLYPDSVYIITEQNKIYLAVGLQGLGNLKGMVLYNDQPLKDVMVKLDGRDSSLCQVTGLAGEYSFLIPEFMQTKEYQVWFSKKGFKTKQFNAFPQTGKPLNIIMEK
jgi:TIR domain